MPSLPFFTPQKAYINASFSCVKASETALKYKQNIGILCLFSATFKTQDLIINGCWSSSTADLVCFLQRLELCRVTFLFGTYPKDTELTIQLAPRAKKVILKFY